MSAEKEIVNYWYNNNGFFTINNIKVNNRDIGIIALKSEKDKVQEINHIEVICSISNNPLEKDTDKFIKNTVKDKFQNKIINKEIKRFISSYSNNKDINKVLVLTNIPKARKEEIIDRFCEKGVRVLELGVILGKIIENLDTQYYKNDVIRTMQIIKYLALTKPEILARLSNNISLYERKEFLNKLLDEEKIVRQFRKTDEKQLVSILKHTSVKDAGKLASMIHKNVLNRNTRKVFFDKLLKLQGVKKKIIEEVKKEISLDKFF